MKVTDPGRIVDQAVNRMATEPAERQRVVTLVTLPQLAERAGIEYRTAHAWVRAGLLIPSIKPTEGTGTPNYFSDDDVDRACGLMRLRSAGVSFEGLLRLVDDSGPLRAALDAWEERRA